MAKEEQVCAAACRRVCRRALNDLESVWLGGGGGGGGRAFVGGGDAPSVADLLLACELEQLTMLNKVRQGGARWGKVGHAGSTSMMGQSAAAHDLGCG